MKALFIVKIAIWWIIFMYLINICLDMISASNTMENIIGFCILILILFVSYTTKCFTTIKFKKNEE